MSTSDVEYTLKWPAEIISEEIERLVASGRENGETEDWQDEVKLFLRQAFATTTPAADFERSADGPLRYGGEEPF